MLTVGSLFSGVGMFDLGFHLAGFQIAWQCDFDEYCQQVLKARQDVFGDTIIYGDIQDLGKGRKYEPQAVDVLIGGFPCQPFSIAGLRKGADDNRNMWGEFARLISDLRPRAIMLENVPAITMDYGTRVIADVTALGYHAQWGIISAQDAGAPHTRERWWLVGYANSIGNARNEYSNGDIRDNRNNYSSEISERGAWSKVKSTSETIPDTQSARWARESRGESALTSNTRCGSKRVGAICQSRMAGDAHGTTCWVDGHRFPNGLGEPQHAGEPPRTVTQKPANWKHRVKALGNGGIPQIAYLLALGIREELANRQQSR